MAFDLDAYLERIGYRGDRAPTLDTLRSIHLRHAQAIPFENLDPLLGITPKLDPVGLQEKLVHGGRGGYCFEQNLLLRHALEAIGFPVTGFGARVVWGAPPGATTARSHMLMRVDLDEGPHVADVGFGGVVLTGPLRLVPDVEQSTPHEPFRLAGAEDAYRLEVKIRDEWQPLYRFDLTPQQLIDYEVANWYVSTHPRSIFRNGIMMARVDGDRRYALRNTDFAVHHPGGRTDRRTLTSVGELRSVMTDRFRITLPSDPALDAALERVVTNRN